LIAAAKSGEARNLRSAVDTALAVSMKAQPMPRFKQIELHVGDRIKMSALGSERSPLLARKFGTITGVRRDSRTIFVRFDGNRTTTTLHRDYIEPIEA
jgi:hypothetical protein